MCVRMLYFFSAVGVAVTTRRRERRREPLTGRLYFPRDAVPTPSRLPLPLFSANRRNPRQTGTENGAASTVKGAPIYRDATVGYSASAAGGERVRTLSQLFGNRPFVVLAIIYNGPNEKKTWANTDAGPR